MGMATGIERYDCICWMGIVEHRKKNTGAPGAVLYIPAGFFYLASRKQS